MATLTKTDALDLARLAIETATAVGTLRTTRWETSTNAEDRALADAQWELLALSGRLETDAVGAVLDETQVSVRTLKATVTRARDTLKTIQSIKDAVKIASAVVILAGAVATQNPAAIAGAVLGLTRTIAANS